MQFWDGGMDWRENERTKLQYAGNPRTLKKYLMYYS